VLAINRWRRLQLHKSQLAVCRSIMARVDKYLRLTLSPWGFRLITFTPEASAGMPAARFLLLAMRVMSGW
jgi:hypothetical protein